MICGELIARTEEERVAIERAQRAIFGGGNKWEFSSSRPAAYFSIDRFIDRFIKRSAACSANIKIDSGGNDVNFVIICLDLEVFEQLIRKPKVGFVLIVYVEIIEFRKVDLNISRVIQAKLTASKIILGSMHSHLRSKISSSPFSLPLRNYDVKGMPEAIMDSRKLVANAEALGIDKNESTKAVADVSAKLRSGLFPLGRNLTGSNAFIDDRDLAYAPADRHLWHGSIKEIEETAKCLNGIARLGVLYHTGFHYDCSFMRGNIDRTFTDADERDAPVRNRKYANIYPNDVVNTRGK